MKLQTDPKAVARLAGEREDTNWRFRLFLKGIDSSAEMLNAGFHTRLRLNILQRLDRPLESSNSRSLGSCNKAPSETLMRLCCGAGQVYQFN